MSFLTLGRPRVREVATAFPNATMELWAADEQRIVLKPILRRIWAQSGSGRSPPSRCPVQQRYEWRSLVGFVHPARRRTMFHLATSVSIPLAAFPSSKPNSRPLPATPGGRRPDKEDRPGVGSRGVACQSAPPHTRPSLPALPAAYSPELQPAEHLWSLTNAPLLNRHFASIEELENAQAAHCVALQARPELVRSITFFHWWPQRLT